MMTPRRVVGLLIASAVIIAVAFWVSSRNRHPAPVAGQPVLDGLKAAVNDVTELRIAKGDGTHVTLRRQPATWSVGERDYPADTGKVRKLLLDLGALSVVEEKTSDPASYGRIGVEDVNSAKAAGTRIEAVTPKKTYGLIAGHNSGTKSSYVRVSGAAKSFLASPQIMPDANPKQWLERNVLDIPESRIKEVAVTPATGPAYAVSREKKEQTDFTVSNVPKGRELTSPSAGNPVAGELASFTLEDVRKAPPAAADAKADAKSDAKAGSKSDAKAGPQRVVFRTFDGLEVQLDGVKEGEQHFVSITPHSTAKETAAEAATLESRVKGWQYEIPSYKYDLLFKPLDELLKQPEKKEDKTAKKPAAPKPGHPALPPSS
jgi:hypothetical protein